MAIDTTVVRVGILDPNGQTARFSVSVFGIPVRKFYEIGSDEPLSGSGSIKIALADQRCHIPGPDKNYSLLEMGYRPISPFHLEQVHPHSLQPPVRERFIQRSKLANDFA